MVVLAVLATLAIGIAMALWVTFDVFDDGFDRRFGETVISGELPQDFRLRPVIAPTDGELEGTGSFGSADRGLAQPIPSGALRSPCQSPAPWWSSC